MGLNIVLLAAGRGSRLSQYTHDCHKSLLPVAGRPALGYILEEAIRSKPNQIVIVTGYRNADIEAYAGSFSHPVRTIFNQRYAEDTNILSAEIGVSALANPKEGYLIVETDIVMQAEGWRAAFTPKEKNSASRWLTRGVYSRSLTGGALQTDADGWVDDLVYAPEFVEKYDGWPKLLGAVYVSPEQVALDRRLRNAAIDQSIAQYYLMPWVENLKQLRCRQQDFSQFFAASFNDADAYEAAAESFRSLHDKTM